MLRGLSATAAWLLVATVVVTGFYAGDAAASRAAISDSFDAEEAALADRPAGQAAWVAQAGLGAAERLAYWAYRTDGTLWGDGIETVALGAVATPPARAIAAGLSARRPA